MAPLRSYQAVLRLPGYRWFWFGIVLSALGAEAGQLALGWLVRSLTASPVAVGLSLSLSRVTLAIGSLLAGLLLDRGSRRRWMALDNLLRAAALVGAALLAHAGALQGWHLYALGLLLGLSSALTRVGTVALVPALVAPRPDLLATANALGQAEWQIATLVGPALGGLLVEKWSPPGVLLLQAASLVLMAWILIRLPAAVDPPSSQPIPLWPSLWEGVRWFLGSRGLAALTILTFLFNLLYGPFAVALYFYPDHLGTGPAGLGWLLSAFAAGSLAGGLITPSLGERPLRPTLAGIVLLWGLTTGSLAWTRSLVWALILMFLAGAAFSPYNVLATAARQRLLPREVYGRVFGLTLVLTQLGMPIGSWAGGKLVQGMGAPAAIGLAGLACLGLAAGAWRTGALDALDCRSGRHSGPDQPEGSVH
ncbi:MAG: MFS transporter [Firmicutes bacterium]|nr:MFS transporter [Bacillota bacterium]